MQPSRPDLIRTFPWYQRSMCMVCSCRINVGTYDVLETHEHGARHRLLEHKDQQVASSQIEQQHESAARVVRELEQRFSWYREERCLYCGCPLSRNASVLQTHEAGASHITRASARHGPTPNIDLDLRSRSLPSVRVGPSQPRVGYPVAHVGPPTVAFRPPLYGPLYLVVSLRHLVVNLPQSMLRERNGQRVLFGPYRTKADVEAAFVATTNPDGEPCASLQECAVSALATSQPLPHFNLPPRPRSSAVYSSGHKPHLARIDYVIDLPWYDVPAQLLECVGSRKLEAELRHVELDGAARKYLRSTWHSAEGRNTARDKMHALLYVEEAEETNALHRYDIEDAIFTPHPSDQRLVNLAVAGLAEKRPLVLRGDTVLAIGNTTGRLYSGYVHFVNLDSVSISFGTSIATMESRTVQFVIKRSDFRIVHRCIDKTDVFLDDKLADAMPDPDAFALPSALTNLNKEQKEFVDRCFHQDAARLQMLWGPPGTGKTTTIVAYIRSLVTSSQRAQRESGSHFILVCTPSNAASDLITQRLAIQLSPSEMIRIVAPGRLRRDIPDKMRPYTCPEGADNQGHVMPTEHRLRGAIVLVVTLGTAGRLYGCHPWLKGHISHLVVDEAGQATEPLMCAALQFCSTPMTRRIVLAGDPKQLGPVVQSNAAKTFGMNISPLVRLLGIPFVHEKCVYQLIENYRSHPDILCLVNSFYDDRLVNPPSGGKWSRNLSFIRERVTLIHSCSAESVEPDSPSVLNQGEIACVMDRVDHLLHNLRANAHDIVVITPYLKQAQKINQKVFWNVNRLGQMQYDGLRAVTVEAFQGREAQHVVISCVRSTGNENVISADIKRYLGFLKQESRVNVAISRAIDTLTIIGNLALLVKDDSWKKIISRAMHVLNVQPRLATPSTTPFTFPPGPDRPVPGFQCMSLSNGQDGDGSESEGDVGTACGYGDVEAAVVRLEE